MTDVATFDEHGRAHGPDGRFLPTVGLDLERRIPELAAQRRDPSAATTQLHFVSPGLPQVDRWDSRTAIVRGYLANWVVARCAQLRAAAVANLPFRAGAQLPASPMDAGLPSPSSRLGTLLGPAPGGPAPSLTARRLIYWTVLQRILTGKHGWEIEWSGRPGDSEIAGFWPLTSANLRAIPAKGTTTHWFDRFVYGRPDQPRRLAREQVFYGWDPAPDDYRQPYSVLQSGSMPINVAVLIDRYQVAFLRNDARPSTVVVTQAFSSDDDAEAFQRDYEARHRGVDNAGSTAFLEAQPDGSGQADATKAVHIETVGLSQRDARMLETHKNALVEVAGVMGTPWSKIDASGRTFDNEQGEDRSWWRNTVLEDARTLQEEINLELAPLLGSEVGWFDLSQVEQLRPKPPVTASAASVLVAGGIAAPEEVRPWFGLPAERPEGLVKDEPVAEPPAPTEEDDDAGAADPGGDRGTAGGSRRRPTPAAGGGGTSRDGDVRVDHPHGRGLTPEEQEERRTLIWQRADATATTLEGQWRRAFARLFARQQDSAIGRLTGTARAKRWAAASTARSYSGGIRAGVDDVFDPTFWATATRQEAEALYEAVMAAGSARISDVFGIAFDLEAAYAQTFIASRANQLAGQVTETTYRAITDALAEGVAEGESIDDLARRIRDVFDDAIGRRAEVIARTEVISAFNGSASLAAHQLPADVVGGQEWIATRDGRTRQAHAEADGQVVAMGASFLVAGSPMAYPGDPAGGASNTVQCRCTVAFLTPAEVAERSRVVPLSVARALLGTVRAGEFDEGSFRRSLLEVAA